MNTLALIAALAVTAPAADELVGAIVPPYPDGMASFGGSCIGAAAAGIERLCDHSIGIIGDADGEPGILYGARNAGYEGNNPTWQVTDAMAYPELEDGQMLVIGVCSVHGEEDASVFAVVRITPTELFDDVLWARRYDFDSGKFIAQDADGVLCYNEGWGI